jgi:hypothetical protein
MPDAHPQRTTYEARSALFLTGATRSELVRWTNAGILTAYDGGGSQGKRRRFDLRNLVTLAVLVKAHALKVNEAGMKQIAAAIDLCSAKDLRNQDKPVAVWFGIESEENRYQTDPPQEPKAVILPIAWTGDYLTSGYCGTIIGLADIVRRLEQATGEIVQ